MAHGVRDSDWKVFRELREIALDRLSARILAEVVDIARDESRGNHERYRAVWTLLRERDAGLARAFDDPRRSTMLWQLATIYDLGLLEAHEFSRFAPDTRESVHTLLEASGR